MTKLLYLVVLITVLELCSTRSAKNNAKTKSACLPGSGKMPEFKSIALYDNVTLPCPKNWQSVTFAKDCKPITVQQNNITKFMISRNTLNLTRFVVTDSGKYTCKGTDPNGTIMEFTWVLHLKLKKNTVKPAEYKEKAINSAVVFDCRSFANKRLFYSHSKTEQATEISYNYVVPDLNLGLFQLSKLKLDDTGFYYCGKSNLLMHLVVRDRPNVSGKSLVKVGEDAVLKCKYTGSEAFAWYRGSKKMVGKSEAKGQLMNIHNTRYLNLTIANVTSNSIGKYGCSVVIENITLTSSIHLNVLEFDSRIGVYGDYNTPNATIFLQCLSNQGNKATYSLLTKPILSNVPFKVVKMGHGITEIVPGIYQIASLSPSEEGYYKCRASLKGVTIEKELDDVVWMSPS